MHNTLFLIVALIPSLLVPLVYADQVLTKYASTADGFADGNVNSIQVAFITVKKISLGSSGNQYQMQGTLKNTSGQNITRLDVNAMLIDNKAQNVGMVTGIADKDSLSAGQSTSFVGLANEDSQNAHAIAFKMTFGWETP
jgi:hypothetical protein